MGQGPAHAKQIQHLFDNGRIASHMETESVKPRPSSTQIFPLNHTYSPRSLKMHASPRGATPPPRDIRKSSDHVSMQISPTTHAHNDRNRIIKNLEDMPLPTPLERKGKLFCFPRLSKQIWRSLSPHIPIFHRSPLPPIRPSPLHHSS